MAAPVDQLPLLFAAAVEGAAAAIERAEPLRFGAGRIIAEANYAGAVGFVPIMRRYEYRRGNINQNINGDPGNI